jgi:Fe-S-cluster-containing hydrogenase component 2
MALRSPEPPRGGAGQNNAGSNQAVKPAATVPALGSLAGQDDDEVPPPRPVRLTSQMRAVVLPTAATAATAKPASPPPPPGARPPPPRPPAPETVKAGPAREPETVKAGPAREPYPPTVKAGPAREPYPPTVKAGPAREPYPPTVKAGPAPDPGQSSEATIMTDQPPGAWAALQAGTSGMNAAAGRAAAPAGYSVPSESTVMMDSGAMPLPPAAPLGNNDATRMFSVPDEGHDLGGSPLPNNESTRIVDSMNFADLKPMKKSAEAPPSDASIMRDASQFIDASGKLRKKPVADVKARSKAKVTPLDPQRLLVQQEAAERRAQEESGIGNLDKFLEKSGMVKVPAGDELPAEHTIVGKFLGFVGLGDKSSIMTAQPVGKDPVEEAWEAVKEAPLLNGLNPQFVTDAIKSGDLKLISLGRDMLVDVEGKALLVLEGQLSLARFRPEVLERERRAQKAYKAGDKKAEKKEHKRRQETGPVIRMCESNLGLFNEGDLVSLEATGPEAVGLAVYSVTPIRVLSISLPRLDVWRRTYQFFGERVRRAADAARSRLAASTGARALVADFFVRHGLSVAMSLRVRELDKCIECYECEKACEQRYGAKRLSLNGKVLGALDFVDCCHTCVDQRCIDPCAYDAIKFDQEKKEVVILEDSCIGCSLCALACPYDAIEMHDLDDKPLLNLRLQKDNKLGFGDGKPRKAKLRRIASKCDHCVNYEDQACISACPTAALLEIPPEAAFVERTESMADAAKGGYEQSVFFDPNQLFDPKKFYKGLDQEDDKAKKVETSLATGWLWALGILGVLGCIVEIFFRTYIPELSLTFYYKTKYGGLDPEVAVENVVFKATDPLAQWLGYIGAPLMFSSMFYSGRKWIPGLKRFGSQRGWFDWHVWSGAIGPMLVMLHTAGKLDNWVSLAIWSMVATVISGLVGRYISTELPDLASQASLQAVDLERKLAELRNRHAGVNVADRFYDQLRRRYATVAEPNLSGVRAGIRAMILLTRDRLARPFRASVLRFKLRGIKDTKARTRVARLATELALLESHRVLLPRIEPMFREWKIIHIPFAILLTIVAGIHIYIELMR